jgi:hypothetical protein
MILGREFKSRLYLKTRWKDVPLDGRKNNEKERHPNGASHNNNNKTFFAMI